MSDLQKKRDSLIMKSRGCVDIIAKLEKRKKTLEARLEPIKKEIDGLEQKIMETIELKDKYEFAIGILDILKPSS